MSDSKTIELAAVTGAHGVAGDVRLKLFGEGIEALSQHGTFNQATLTLKNIRSDNKGGAIARFAEISGRSQAEKLRGTVLTIMRDDLPVLDEGEYYHADLVGLSVETEVGERVGVVKEIANYGATDVVEITKDPPPPKGQKSFMVPMTKQAVLGWDENRLVIAQDFVDE